MGDKFGYGIYIKDVHKNSVNFDMREKLENMQDS